MIRLKILKVIIKHVGWLCYLAFLAIIVGLIQYSLTPKFENIAHNIINYLATWNSTYSKIGAVLRDYFLNVLNIILILFSVILGFFEIYYSQKRKSFEKGTLAICKKNLLKYANFIKKLSILILFALFISYSFIIDPGVSGIYYYDQNKDLMRQKGFVEIFLVCAWFGIKMFATLFITIMSPVLVIGLFVLIYSIGFYGVIGLLVLISQRIAKFLNIKTVAPFASLILSLISIILFFF